VVDSYDGGYAAFVLARAERHRQASASESRRQNLLRKELAWLRRGAPARTSKPKFRIDAANELIEDVPPPRDRIELQRFATQRLGKQVVDLEDVDLSRGDKQLLRHATWRLGPGDRVGIVGVNGAGKSSVLQLVAGSLAPDHGQVKHGRTIALAHLTQQVPPEDPDARVLPSIEDIRRVTRTATGQDVSASSMLERFGFTGDKLTARIGDLSGGERRRFQLLKLLLEEPNVLLLDEPTNDLDIDTLNVVEDFLDGWPGTLIVVSHDRYFLERVTDSVWALMGDGQISMLPNGVDQYLEARRRGAARPAPAPAPASTSTEGRPDPTGSGAKAKVGGAEERNARKTVTRIDRQLKRISAREAALTEEMAAAVTDHEKLTVLSREARALARERDELEAEWLEAVTLLE
jgi:ATP-binding cassette subfamily F protein uup